MDCDSRRTGGKQPCVDCRRNEVNERVYVNCCLYACREICGRTYLVKHLFWRLGSMGGTPDESRLAVGNKEDRKCSRKRLMKFTNFVKEL